MGVNEGSLEPYPTDVTLTYDVSNAFRKAVLLVANWLTNDAVDGTTVFVGLIHP